MKKRVMKTLGIGLGLVSLLSSMVGACGSDTGNNVAGSSASTSTSSGNGSGGSGGGGLVGGNCNPACTAPQFCSITNVCLDAGSCGADSDCEAGKVCDLVAKTCVIGGCNTQEATAEGIPPNLLVVLDRSCSMQGQKWQTAVQAINTLTANFKGQIRFGLTLFPDRQGDNCTQGTIPVPVADGNEQAIQDLMTASLKAADPNFPDGPCVTNIDTAVLQGSTEPSFNDMGRDSYMVLITDGMQSSGCGGNAADPKTIQYLTDLYQKGVPTFVIGFALGTDTGNMDQFAEAGGVPNMSGSNKFYDAADQASLDAVLDAIAKQTLGCSFTLDKTPPNVDEIYVFFDNANKVPRDPAHTSGWDYDAATNQVTFYGQYCDDLKNNVVKDVDIVFSCDAPTPN